MAEAGKGVDEGAGSGIENRYAAARCVVGYGMIAAESDCHAPQYLVQAHVPVDAGHALLFLVVILIEMWLDGDDPVLVVYRQCTRPGVVRPDYHDATIAHAQPHHEGRDENVARTRHRQPPAKQEAVEAWISLGCHHIERPKDMQATFRRPFAHFRSLGHMPWQVQDQRPVDGIQGLPEPLHVSVVELIEEDRVGQDVMLRLQIGENGRIGGKIHRQQVISGHCPALGGEGIVERRAIAKDEQRPCRRLLRLRSRLAASEGYGDKSLEGTSEL